MTITHTIEIQKCMLYIFAHFTKFILFYILKDKENLYIVDICNEITKCPQQGGCISEKNYKAYTKGKINYTQIFKLILFIILMKVCIIYFTVIY